MPSVSSLHKYFPLDDDCEAALLALQLTVACALRDVSASEIDEVLREHEDVLHRLPPHIADDAYVGSLRDGSSAWRRALLDWVADGLGTPCDGPVHRLVILLELCTSSVFVDCERLQAGAAVRRTDFLLDLLEADGWCGDVRQRYVDAGQILVGHATRPWLPKAASRARKLADLIAPFQPGAQFAAAVLDWVDDDPTVAVPVTPVPDLARALGVCLLAGPDERNPFASSAALVLVREIDKMSRRVQALQRGAAPMYDANALSKLRALQCSQVRGLEFLMSLVPHGLVRQDNDPPTLVGHRLPEARAVLARVAGDVDVDVVSTVSGRGVRAEGNWHVVGQERLASGGVRLLVSKNEA